MTFDQGAIIGLLLCMFAVYALDRFRVELVALCGLALGAALGLVPMTDIFSGFSSPAVVTVAEVLLIVTVLARTHVVERFARAIIGKARTERGALVVLCATGALVSVPMNNIGALALMFPVTLSVSARLGLPPGRMLMPLSFATLLGGLCSLTGTPANLIVNDWLRTETGKGWAYFELGLVGAPVTLAGLACLVLLAPILFRHLRGDADAPAETGPTEMLCEVTVPPGSTLTGTALPEAEAQTGVQFHGVVRGDAHVFARREAIILAPGDTLIAEGPIERIEALHDAGALRWAGALREAGRGSDGGADMDRLDVVVMPDSIVLGSHLAACEGFAGHGVEIVAIGGRRRRVEGRFEDLQIGLGDVLMLRGPRAAARAAAADALVLPLSPRAAPAPRHPDALRSLAIFVLGVAATASGYVPPEIAFGGVVVAMALLGTLRLQQALQELNWPILILLACMIPLGAAMEQSGAAQTIANALVGTLPSTDPALVTLMVLLITVMVTPFVDNVSTAVVLSPVAAGISAQAGVPVEPLLVAVAIGASLDFLTPFGHHNNAVVMGAAGYRFRDFPRLGLPLLLVCTAVAFVFIWLAWL
ncbi:MAG TPA: SLC13 family permease [Sphingobium sp.]|nr:SLC13 family permease [Sphingobium sp.]